MASLLTDWRLAERLLRKKKKKMVQTYDYNKIMSLFRVRCRAGCWLIGLRRPGVCMRKTRRTKMVQRKRIYLFIYCLAVRFGADSYAARDIRNFGVQKLFSQNRTTTENLQQFVLGEGKVVFCSSRTAIRASNEEQHLRMRCTRRIRCLNNFMEIAAVCAFQFTSTSTSTRMWAADPMR